MAGLSIDIVPDLSEGYREAVIQAMAGELGAGLSHVPDYLESCSLPRDAKGLQWCGIMVLAALHSAGLALGIPWAIGRGFLLTGPCPLTATQAPAPGDVSYLAVPFAHHAVIESVGGDTIHTIDGNQGPPHYITRRSHKRGSGHTYYSISPLIDRAVAALNAGSARSSNE